MNLQRARHVGAEIQCELRIAVRHVNVARKNCLSVLDNVDVSGPAGHSREQGEFQPIANLVERAVVRSSIWSVPSRYCCRAMELDARFPCASVASMPRFTLPPWGVTRTTPTPLLSVATDLIGESHVPLSCAAAGEPSGYDARTNTWFSSPGISFPPSGAAISSMSDALTVIGSPRVSACGRILYRGLDHHRRGAVVQWASREVRRQLQIKLKCSVVACSSAYGSDSAEDHVHGRVFDGHFGVLDRLAKEIVRVHRAGHVFGGACQRRGLPSFWGNSTATLNLGST